MDASTNAEPSLDAQQVPVDPQGDFNLALTSPRDHGESETGSMTLAPDDHWKRELAARLERYRSRRKTRAPRYPSLHLPFDSGESSPTHRSHEAAPSSQQRAEPYPPLDAYGDGRYVSGETASLWAPEPVLSHAPTSDVYTAAVEAHSNVIEFPRSAVVPVFAPDELAEPVFDRPRIIEAPEVVPPPPVLGGILLEARTPENHSRAVEPLLVGRASLLRRLLAWTIDSVALLAAFAGFAAIFLRLNPGHLPLLPAIAAAASALVLLWFVYDFLLVGYSGRTLGWYAARLHLVQFSGLPVTARQRRFRVLASFLSTLALGLGFFWSLLDENALCWHDRITGTYLRSSRAAARNQQDTPPQQAN